MSENSEICPLQAARYQSDVFRLLVLSNQAAKTQRYSKIVNSNDRKHKKVANPHNGETRHKVIWHFC